MAWYYGTYSCGHEGRVNLIGPTKDREWKKEKHFSGLCPECYKKALEQKRQSEDAAAEKAAEEMELPELSGSPKQKAWANTIRVNTIEKLAEGIRNFRNSGKEKSRIFVDRDFVFITVADMDKMMDILIQKTEAKFWIDHRGQQFDILLSELYKELAEDKIPDEVNEEIIKEEAALTVEPNEKTKEGIVKIYSKNEAILAEYKKDDAFREIVKSLGYTWDGCWSKNVTEYTGPEKDRIAELGNKLLANGFTVQFPDSESRDMAVSGVFLQECKRWVKYNTEKEKLSISWKEYNDDIYQAARKISGAKWRNGSMLVPVEYFSEVMDFAETMGFKFSERAKKEIEHFKTKSANFMKKDVEEAIPEEKNGKEELRRQLEKSGVIEDLKDEA